MRTHYQIIRFWIMIGLLWSIAGCSPAPTPEEKKRAEIDRKYPGINYGSLAGYIHKRR